MKMTVEQLEAYELIEKNPKLKIITEGFSLTYSLIFSWLSSIRTTFSTLFSAKSLDVDSIAAF